MVQYLFKPNFVMLVIFLFSCSSQQMVESKSDVDKLVNAQQELIKDTIKDKQNQTELLEIINAMNLDGMKFAKFYSNHRNEVKNMIKDKDISRQEFESELSDINNHYVEYLKTLLQKRKVMRSLVSADEWIKIMDWDDTYVPK